MTAPHDRQSQGPDQTSVPTAAADLPDAAIAAASDLPPDHRAEMLQEMASTVVPHQPVLLDEGNGKVNPLTNPCSDAVPSLDQVGTRYQLSGEIARGGMGAVLRGRDVDLGRELAVKVLLEKYANRPDVARRFIEEAQIGGQLQHPGVVPVYDIGQFGNRPFFTMKLVRGQTLAALLKERPNSSVDRPRFLTIALQVAQTLAYAHARGVIHRDLKPANIMVGAFGEVQVMDWGLAKVLDSSGAADQRQARDINQPEEDETAIRTMRSSDSTGSFSGNTEAGSLLGTLAYMPPEQANGDARLLDRRADVFGLGAILCEILTGQPPYLGRSGTEVLRKAASGDLADANARLGSCGADAELVTLTQWCLSPQADDRPQDARAVSDALTAYLDGVQDRLRRAELLQVEAQARAEEEVKLRVLSNQLATEAQARVVEERKRHQVTRALAGSMLALGLLAGGGAFWIMQERQALATQVNLTLNEADARREEARLANGDMNLWMSAREAAQRATSLLRDKGSLELRQRTRELVARIEQEYEDARRDRRLLDALADVRAGRMDRGLAATDTAYASALADYRVDLIRMNTDEAARIFLSRPGTFAIDVAAALDDWSLIRRGIGNTAVDGPQPLDVARAIDPDPYREKIRTTLKQTDLRPHREVLWQLASEAHADELPPSSAVLLAQALVGAGDVDAAVALLRRSTERHPDDLWVNFELGSHLLELRPAQVDEAIRYFTAARSLRPTTAHALAHVLEERGRTLEAIAVFQDLERRQPEEGSHASCLGLALKGQGRSDAASAAFERAIKIYQSALSAHPEQPILLHNLGMAFYGQGHWNEAADAFRAALRLQPGMAQAHSSLGVVLKNAGRSVEAEAAYREALRIDPELLTARANLASVLQDQGRFEEAIAEFRTLILRQPHRAILHFNLGNALWARHELEDAAAEQREALRLDPDQIDARVNLGCILYDSGSIDEGLAAMRDALRRRPDHRKALENLAKALSIKDDLDGLRELVRDAPGIARLQQYLGKTLCDRERYSEALGPLEEGVKLDPDSGWGLLLLGVCQAKLMRYEQAVETLHRAARNSPNDPVVFFNLGSAHYARNEYDAAIAAFRQSLGLQPDQAHVHAFLAHALVARGDRAGSIAEYQHAIRLDPTDADSRYQLGRAFENSEANGDAILAYREAIRLRPDFPDARNHLGVVLYKNGNAQDALIVSREAVHLHPEIADGHYGLGTMQMLVGQLDEATASFREAVRLDPNHPEAHCNLGQALKSFGLFEESLDHFRRGHELGSKRANWRYPSADWVADCERFVQVDRFLRDVLEGKAQPQDNSQRFALGLVAQMKGLYANSVRFYSEAIEADPELTLDPSRSSLRYRAACVASLAGYGRGKDDPRPDEAEMAKFRSQARDWLRADLEAWNSIAKSSDAGKRQGAANAVAQWKKEADLAVVREEKALETLPADERQAWQEFWTDVDRALNNIEKP